MQKYAHLVELEKCCQSHIFLQNFVLIEPRTSPPKICKTCKNFAKFVNFLCADRAPGDSEALEGLGRRHLVDEVPVDVEQSQRSPKWAWDDPRSDRDLQIMLGAQPERAALRISSVLISVTRQIALTFANVEL